MALPAPRTFLRLVYLTALALSCFAAGAAAQGGRFTSGARTPQGLERRSLLQAQYAASSSLNGQTITSSSSDIFAIYARAAQDAASAAAAAATSYGTPSFAAAKDVATMYGTRAKNGAALAGSNGNAALAAAVNASGDDALAAAAAKSQSDADAAAAAASRDAAAASNAAAGK